MPGRASGTAEYERICAYVTVGDGARSPSIGPGESEPAKPLIEQWQLPGVLAS
jgi:hypothetical protein